MATLPELEDALRNADAAGDAAAAQQLADEIVRMRGQSTQTPAPQTAPSTIPTMLSGMDSPVFGSGQVVPAATPPAPAPVNQGADAATYVLQRADRGLADAAGAPVDLMSAGLNIGAFGVDKIAELFGGNFDARVTNPVMGSDWIADKVSGAYEGAGGTIVPEEAVSGGVKTAGTLARGGAAAMAPGMAMASAPVQAASQGRRFLAPLTAPYQTNVGSTLARDAVAGGGAAMGGQAYDDFAPEAVQESSAGPLLKMLASIIGGVGGAGAVGMAEGLAQGGSSGIKNAITGGDKNAPIDSVSQKPFSGGEMDMAARIAQEIPSSKMHTLDALDAKEFDFAPPNARPTTGMASDDIGMALHENNLRAKDGQRFIEQDTRRRAYADRLLDETSPRGADARAFTGEAQRQYDDTLARAEQGVESSLQDQEAATAELRRQNADLEGYRAGQPRVSAAMADDFDAERRAARQRKNELYDAADPRTEVEGGLLSEAVRRIDEQMPEAERMVAGPYSQIANRVRALVEQVDPETGDIAVRNTTYGDIKALRAQVSEARKAAVTASGQSVAGSGADVQRLDQLGAVLNRLADEINPEAARHYREEYAPRFKQGKAGEYGAAIDRSTRTGGESSATRPSEFGDKFLAKPEDAASFRRAMTPPASDAPRIEGPAPARGSAETLERPVAQNAREWMLGDLAKSGVLTDNAELRYDKFRQWADKNRATIDQFPEIRQTIDRELAAAQRGGALSRQLASQVAQARGNLKTTQRELQQSALSSVLGKSPEKAIGSIMGGADPERQMAEIVQRTRGNKDAKEGLKAATRDWIRSKASNSGGLLGHDDAAMLSQAKLSNLFKQHEKTLATVYGPDEMNALRQAHKLMKVETSRDIRSSSGSNTADKINMAQKTATEQRKRVLEAGLKLKYGVLLGGGINRTVNLFLSALPNKDRAINEILFEMHFNPDLAKHLLTRPIKEVGSEAWNSKLNLLLAAATGARESVEGGDK